MLQYKLIVVGLALATVCGDNSTSSDLDTCDLGPWRQALEDWATTSPAHSDRHGRIMALAPATGYYVTERIDTPILQPPPPPPAAPAPKSTGYKMPHVPQGYSEWEVAASGPGKVVNRPPYKDKFKPSPPLPGGPQYPTSMDRIDEMPQKRVTETDLYLLSAMEKLVQRADLTDKRLRAIEESLRQLMGADDKPETPSCASGFHRVGGGCYWWSAEAVDWKDASRGCRRRAAALLELPQREDARALITALLADRKLKGDDFWTGGLNPGLLWIWSNSARPIQSNTTDNATVTISGDGRCLALVHEPTVHSYLYRGQDCGVKHRYICQQLEQPDKISNEIQKKARALRHEGRQARILLDLQQAYSNS